MGLSLLAIGVGAAIGAVLRWLLAVWLNDWLPQVPPGTLAANLIGGYCIGIAVVVFLHHTHIAPEWRLFIITGLLGGLTTFSTFSAEVMQLLQAGRVGWAMAAISAHVAGSLAATWAGIASARWWLLR
jgi:fluoride exporter